MTRTWPLRRATGVVRPPALPATPEHLLAHAENHLIELLPRRDRQRLLALAEPVQLEIGELLSEPGQLASHVYFPVDGFVSMVTRIDDQAVLEVGMVGREGMLGTHLALGVDRTPLQVRVQGAGASWRFGRTAFRAELARCAPLQQVVDRYLDVRMAQLASAVACQRFHLIVPRLARWLLMCQDRAHANHLHLTHETVASMLGVRRVGITVAAGLLQRSGLIEYRRGELRVLDRRRLKATACSCYALDRRVYIDRLGRSPA